MVLNHFAGKALPLLRRLVQDHRRRHPRIQRLHPIPHGNRNPRTQVRHSIPRRPTHGRRMRTSGHNLNPSHAQLRQQHRNRHTAQHGKPQPRSRRRAQRLRRPRVRTPASRHHSGRAKSLRRPHNRPNISRILHRRQHHHQRRVSAQRSISRSRPAHHIIERPRRLQEKRRHSLRRLGASHRGKQFVRSPHHPRTRNPRLTPTRRAQNPFQVRRLARFAHQQRLRLQSRTQRVLHQLRPFHTNPIALRRPRPAQSRAKYLQPLILAARNRLFTQV